MPAISVIVPVYKVEKYLETCVDSLLSQTFSDIEIILVDDGSPDQCGTICDAYAQSDARVRVIHQPNGGLSRARNAGVAAARGSFVCFVDSDDYVAPEYCETLYTLLKNSDCDFSVCEVCRFQDGTKPSPVSVQTQTYMVSNVDFLSLQLKKKSEFGVWNKLYHRELFERIQFAEGRIHEDVIWSGDLARQLHGGVMMTSKQLYYYRQRSGSIVHAGTCSADRVYAGEYLIDTARMVCPELISKCLRYAAEHPFSYVDRIYVGWKFGKNKAFLKALRTLLRRYSQEYKEHEDISPVLRYRMSLFARSGVLYGINAYMRLIRVYLYRIIGKDAYADGHGI